MLNSIISNIFGFLTKSSDPKPVIAVEPAPIIEPNPNQFNLFIERLNEVSLISAEDMCEQFLEDVSQEHFSAILKFLLKEENRALYTHLKPGEAIRIPKSYAPGESFFPRTMTIACDLFGEFQCIVHTGSKKAKLDPSNKPIKKQNKKKSSGSNKYGKPAAWRVDGKKPIPLWKATIDLTDLAGEDLEKMLRAINHEVNVSARFNSTHVQKITKGAQYTSGGQTKINLFSERADSDLCDLMINEVELTLEQQNQMISDLLNGLQEIHLKIDANGLPFVHQDIKPDNVFTKIHKADGKVSYSVMIGDLESTRGVYLDDSPVGTILYYSPKLLHAVLKRNRSLAFSNSELSKTLVYALCKSGSGIPKALLLNSEKANQANDIWALGIVIFIIKYGQPPGFSDFETLILTDPLLKAMLCIDEDERANITQAREIHQKCVQKGKKVELEPTESQSVAFLPSRTPSHLLAKAAIVDA